MLFLVRRMRLLVQLAVSRVVLLALLMRRRARLLVQPIVPRVL